MPFYIQSCATVYSFQFFFYCACISFYSLFVVVHVSLPYERLSTPIVFWNFICIIFSCFILQCSANSTANICKFIATSTFKVLPVCKYHIVSNYLYSYKILINLKKLWFAFNCWYFHVFFWQIVCRVYISFWRASYVSAESTQSSAYTM